MKSQLNQQAGKIWNQKLPKAFGDTIWYEDFDSVRWSQYGLGEGPEGWQFYDSTGNDFYWGWSNHGPRGRYISPNGGEAIKEELLPWNGAVDNMNEAGATADNGFMMLESGFFNTNEEGELASNPIKMNSWFQTGFIDLSGYANLQVAFNQLYRLCCSASNIHISMLISSDYHIDPENAHWTEYDALGDYFAISDMTQRPDKHLTFDISEFAGEDSVVIRFYKQGLSHYYWMIDDILISESPAYDMVLEHAWYDYGILPENMQLFDSYFDIDPERIWNGGYTKIPEPQVQDFVCFRAAIKNFGTQQQNDAKLEVSAYQNGDLIFDEISQGISIDAGDKDTLQLNTTFSTLGKGMYQLSSTVVSENEDQKPFDNYKDYAFEVTDSVYSRTYDPPYSNYMNTQPFVVPYLVSEIITKYEIIDTTFITVASVYIWDNDSEEQQADIAAGNYSVIAKLYRFKDGVLDTAPVLTSDPYIIQSEDTMSFVKVCFNQQEQNEIIEPGIYYAGFEFMTGFSDKQFEIAVDRRIEQPFDAYYGLYDGEIAIIGYGTPVINLYTKPYEPQVSIQRVETTSVSQVFPNPANSIINIISEENIHFLEFYDIIGKKYPVHQNYAVKNPTISIAHLPDGVYFIRINKETHKIIISH